MALGTPHFGGEGYLVLHADAARTPASDQEELVGRMRERRDVSFLYLNFSTTQDNGMILWSAEVTTWRWRLELCILLLSVCVAKSALPCSLRAG